MPWSLKNQPELQFCSHKITLENEIDRKIISLNYVNFLFLSFSGQPNSLDKTVIRSKSNTKIR